MLGYGVVRYAAGANAVLTIGVVETAPTKVKGPTKGEDKFRRLRETSAVLWDLAKRFEIDALAFEALSIPRQTSKQNAISIGFPYGIAAMLCTVLDLPGVGLSPQAVKKALCGKMGASKNEVEAAVLAEFGDDGMVKKFQASCAKTKQNHAFDALGIYLAASNTDIMRALRRGA